METIDPRGDEVGWACGTFAKIAVVHQVVQLAEAAWQQAPVGSLKDEARKTSDTLKKLPVLFLCICFFLKPTLLRSSDLIIFFQLKCS